MQLLQDHIEIKPNVCHGKPVIKGTRIPVSHILAVMAGGDTIAEILEDYPTLRIEDINVTSSLFTPKPHGEHPP